MELEDDTSVALDRLDPYGVRLVDKLARQVREQFSQCS